MFIRLAYYILFIIVQVATAPPDTQGTNLDIAAAYRTLPILPDHRRYLCCQIKNHYFMDHCFPFGAKNAHNRLGITVDAIIDILKAVKIGPIPKWADNLFPIRFPISSTLLEDHSVSYRYSYDLDTLKNAISPLCVPWHASKWNDFSSSPIYLGLVWNFDNHTISLSEPKRLKYLSKVSDFLCDHSSSCVFKKRAMSLLGTLSHVTIVHRDGCSYLSAVTAFISPFTSDYIPRYPCSAVFKDLEWWASKLSQPDIYRSLVHRGD